MQQKKPYNPKDIEPKWAKKWEEDKTYKTPAFKDLDKSKPKFHVLDMFPYPSGEGLHAGHAKTFGGSDIYARFKRLQGYNVLHATGFDAFGLPAEQYALKMKTNPKIQTKKNTDNFERQMKMLGFSYDYDRIINTTDPAFYKWTQWAWKQMFKKGLCYESNEPINWCPSCKTGLANEDLDDGKCERCGSIVEKKPLRQWVIKITEYAEKLLTGLDNLDWKESTKDMQRNWIGKSEGAEINFKIVFKGDKYKNSEPGIIPIFTTRPDTLFGATYMVLAPEHLWVKLALEKHEGIFSNEMEVRKYVDEAKNKTEIERTALGKEKNGVKLEGVMAVNPANGEEIPVYIADYVLATYGTGAIMAVPAHDERDYEFAKKYNIPVKQVVEEIKVTTGEKDDAFRPSEEIVYRDVVAVCVRNPKTNEYLTLSWKGQNMKGAVTGGLEGDSVEVAARKEVHEETGYKNLKLIKISDYRKHTKFFHRIKKVNRHAAWNFAYFELIDEEKDEISPEESAMHEVFWTKESDLLKILTVPEAIWAYEFSKSDVSLYTGPGILTNSGKFDSMDSEDAKRKITEEVGGKMVTKYKIKDWVFARQRYWGEPFPVVFGDNLENLKLKEKTFVDNVSVSKVREGLPYVERDAIAALVKHPTEDKYIGLKWKKVAWGTLVTGGIEKGQSALEAAKAEVVQETGYKNFSRELNLGLIHSEFFHVPKNENRRAHINVIYLELKDLEKFDVSKEESELHEVKWLGRHEMISFLTPEAHKYVFENVLAETHKPFVVADSELPVVLPDVENYEPTGTGEGPLADIKDWVEVEGYINSDGEFVSKKSIENVSIGFTRKLFDMVFGEKKYKKFYRESNTMPQWAGSSWYWLRYMDPHNDSKLVSREEEKYWSSNGHAVDMYIGGMEHATRHLIYGRFWNQFLNDIGVASYGEPFRRLETVGLVLGSDGTKMSKRLGNVVNPDDIVNTYGADTLRMYISFTAPFADSFNWDEKSIIGSRRFIERIWDMQYKLSEESDSEEIETLMHKTIKKVGTDIEKMNFNTAVAQMMIFGNAVEKAGKISKENYKKLLQLVSPIAPFVTEEIWSNLGEKETMHKSSWPEYEEEKCKDKNVNIAVQINGKLRDTFVAEADLEDERVVEMAKSSEGYKKWVAEATPKKVIVVKNKVVNIVV